ncbi:MAG TPA: hypothetical protein VHR47_11725 [Bacillota bacterium]|nr:hypothetical protein [Bacillota bacterium]
MKKLLIGLCILLLLAGFVVGYNWLFSQPNDLAGKAIQTKVTENPSQEERKPSSKNKDYLAIGFDLLANESLGFLRYGLADTDVVGLLGEADEKSKAVWEVDGEEHQSWYYHFKGIKLDMIKKGDGQVVNAIEISGPCEFRTLKDIGIGSFKGQVLNAYEDAIDPKAVMADRTMLIAGTNDAGIIFRFQGNRVTSIFMGAVSKY